MSFKLDEKKLIVAEIANEISNAQIVILSEYRGLKVSQFTEIRSKLREAGVFFRVIKNTFVRRAVGNTPYSELAHQMTGPLVYGIGKDPVLTAKILHEFSKNNDKFIIKAGALNTGLILTSKDIAALATLPSRDELLSSLLGTMQAPIAKFVRTLHEIPTKFVRGLAAVRDQKQ